MLRHIRVQKYLVMKRPGFTCGYDPYGRLSSYGALVLANAASGAAPEVDIGKLDLQRFTVGSGQGVLMQVDRLG